MARFGAPGGIAATAAIFSLYHLSFHPISLVSKFLIGVVLGVMRQRDPSLVGPGVAHFLIWAVIGAA